MQTYQQCSECKRLIRDYPPEMQASHCPPLFTFIDGKRVCWECEQKMVAKLGIVPSRTPEAFIDSPAKMPDLQSKIQKQPQHDLSIDSWKKN